MDIYCRVCGEPWDHEELHEQISVNHPDEPWSKGSRMDSRIAYEAYYNEARATFAKVGCGFFDGASHGLSRLSEEDSLSMLFQNEEVQ